MLDSPHQTAQLFDIFKQRGKKQQYRKGDFIIRPDESLSGVFYIESGLVKAYDMTKYGEENLLIIRKPDEVFPLIWAITGQERHVIYQTLAATTVWRISRSQFLEAIAADPTMYAPLLDLTLEMYRLHSERILNLEYRTVRERIISFLITMSQRFGKSTKDGMVLEVPLRHQDVASSVNATRETASRELSALERKGYISNDHGFIVLKDVDGLQKHLS